ncbi:MAG: TonB-dependent receptor [bacterium]
MKSCYFNYTVFLLVLVLLPAHSRVFGQTIKLREKSSRFDSVSNAPGKVVTVPTRVLKRMENVPFGANLVNDTNYRYDRKTGAADILSPVPGLFLQSLYDDYHVRFSARGYGTGTNTGTRGVRILLDDIPESDPDGQTIPDALDFNTIGRIEVMKGNASSLYPSSPGGAVNFISDLNFDRSSVTQFNLFGSSGLFCNGIKAAVKTGKYRLLTSYGYTNFNGYRNNNNEFRHQLNLVIETRPSAYTRLTILGYFIDGQAKLPGALTKDEFEQNPYQADPLYITNNERVITSKGRLAIRYNASFGKKNINEVEVAAWGAIQNNDVAEKDYRIINQYRFGFTGTYVNKTYPGNRYNEFLIGVDLYSQPSRTEYYENSGGSKGNQLLLLLNSNIISNGIFVSDNFEIIRGKLFAMLSGRLDQTTYKKTEETPMLASDSRKFTAFNPRLALNYKPAEAINIFTSYGYSHDHPSVYELNGHGSNIIFNRDPEPQVSRNFELGARGKIGRPGKSFAGNLQFEATFFHARVSNELVPYTMSDTIFYRNAAKTSRLGVELGCQAEIIPGLNFGVSWTWSHLIYLSYPASESKQDSTGTYITTEDDFSGNVIPGIPRSNLFISLAYSHPLGKHISIMAKCSYQMISRIWANDSNSENAPGYHLLGGLLGADFTFGRFKVTVSGGMNNMLNEVYSGFTSTNATGNRYYNAGAPRNFFSSVNLGYTF